MSAQVYDLTLKTLPVLIALATIVGSWYVVKYQVAEADRDIKKLDDRIDNIVTDHIKDRANFATKEALSLVESSMHLKITDKMNLMHEQLQNLIVEVRELRSDYKEILRERRQ